jgi:hypothetical protein
MRKIMGWTVACLMALIGLVACGGGGGGGGGSTPAPAPPFIDALLFSFPTGSLPPANFANALVSVGTDSASGSNITTANITMNGVILTYNAAPTHQQYEGTVTVAPGGSVTLSVTVGGITYTVSGTQFSNYPTITVPVSGATFTAGSTNTVTWSAGAPLANAVYLLGVLDAVDPDGGTPYFHALSTSLNMFSIPPGSLMPGNRVVIVGITTPVSIPNAATSSTLAFGGYNYVPVAVN